MEALWYLVLGTFSVCLMKFEGAEGISYISENMDDSCGSRITVYGDHQLQLYFADDDECEVTIATTSTFPMMMLYFQTFRVSCMTGSVNIKNEYGLKEDLCGFVSTNTVYTYTGDVKIKYTPEGRWSHGSFTLIVTLYSYSSSCPSWGHVCDNGRCIDADLKCNGYNSCGDNSECWSDSKKFNYNSASGVAIGIGVTIGVIFIITVSVTVICCKRRSVGTPGQHNRATATAPPMQVVYVTQANRGQLNQGFSHELYGTQMQQTAVNYPSAFGQSPPPYNPEWATKEMKPEGQDAELDDQAAVVKTLETGGPKSQGDKHVYDNLAAENSDEQYSTLDEATVCK